MNEENKEAVDTATESELQNETDDKAKQLIKRYTMGSMAVGVVPIPIVDLAALVALQLKMLHALAKNYDVEFKANMGKSAISSLVGGVTPVYAAAPVAASLAKFIPVVGTAASYGSLVMLNGASTYAIGKVFQQHFASGGTFLTFNPESVRSYFAEQYEKGKGIVDNLKGSGDETSKKPNGSSKPTPAYASNASAATTT